MPEILGWVAPCRALMWTRLLLLLLMAVLVVCKRMRHEAHKFLMRHPKSLFHPRLCESPESVTQSRGSYKGERLRHTAIWPQEVVTLTLWPGSLSPAWAYCLQAHSGSTACAPAPLHWPGRQKWRTPGLIGIGAGPTEACGNTCTHIGPLKACTLVRNAAQQADLFGE